MSRCSFCGEDFSNAQAVRGHLRGCLEYLKHKSSSAYVMPKARLPIGSAYKAAPHSQPVEGSAAHVAADQLQADRIGLELRQVRRQHRSLDLQELKEKQAEEEEKRQKDLRENQVLLDAQARGLEAARLAARDAAIAARARRRREVLQEIKARASAAAPAGAPEGLKSTALIEIEKRLSGLAVEEIPQAELLKIAAGIMEECLSPWREEQAAAAEAGERDREREKRRSALLEYGEDYCRGQLEEEKLDGWERLRLIAEARDELEDEVDGSESRGDVRALVDDIIDDLVPEES